MSCLFTQGQISEFEEFIVYKSERVLPEYIITCLPPKTPSFSLTAGITQPAATAAAIGHVQSLPNLPTTNGHSNSAPGSPTNSVHSVEDLDDEESWELQYLRSSSVPSDDGGQKGDKTSNRLVAKGPSGAKEERSNSVEEVDPKEEMCESAEEDVFESPEEDVCESAGEEEDLYSPASSMSTQQTQASAVSSVSKQDSASADASNVSNEDSTATSSVSPMFKDEDEFQRHLLEVRRRVQQKRRAEEAAQARLGETNSVPVPAPVYIPPQVQLDDDHQRRLLEVRKRVRERRMKEGKLSTDEVMHERSTVCYLVKKMLLF